MKKKFKQLKTFQRLWIVIFNIISFYYNKRVKDNNLKNQIFDNFMLIGIKK